MLQLFNTRVQPRMRKPGSGGALPAACTKPSQLGPAEAGAVAATLNASTAVCMPHRCARTTCLLPRPQWPGQLFTAVACAPLCIISCVRCMLTGVHRLPVSCRPCHGQGRAAPGGQAAGSSTAQQQRGQGLPGSHGGSSKLCVCQQVWWHCKCAANLPGS